MAKAVTTGRLEPAEDEGNRANNPITLGKKRITIGRGPNNHVVLPDPEVSKRHAEIEFDDGGFILNDLGSSNGTFVNGDPVRRHRLVPGDYVEIGACRYDFKPGEVGTGGRITIAPDNTKDTTQILASAKVGNHVSGSEIETLEELRARYDRVRTALLAVQKLIETTDISQLCHAILDVSFQLVKAQTGAVLLFDDKRELVPWAHRSNLPPGTANIMISRTIVDGVIKDRCAVLASDVLADSRWSTSHSIVMSGVRSLMCVPLLSGERIFGILHVGNVTQAGAFLPGDLELMNGIGAGGGVALANAFLAHRLAEEAKTRESLGRFLSPQLVEQVVQNHVQFERGGSEQQVTVMFADIRGFTSMTERTPATDVVKLLNDYFDQMVELVFTHGGSLDKFIGDAIMAVWGVPQTSEDDPKRAMAAARDMQKALTQINEDRAEEGKEQIRVGIGLATGVCVAGAIGARRRMEFTVIGDGVNLAARLSGIAEGGEVLCDESTWRLGGKPKDTKRLPDVSVKGKDKPVEIYRVGRQT